MQLIKKLNKIMNQQSLTIRLIIFYIYFWFSLKYNFPDFIIIDHKVKITRKYSMWIVILIKVRSIVITTINYRVWIRINVCFIRNTNIVSFSKCWAIIWIIPNRIFSWLFFKCKLVAVIELKNERLSIIVCAERITWIPFTRSKSTYYFALSCFNDCQRVLNTITFFMKLFRFKWISSCLKM